MEISLDLLQSRHSVRSFSPDPIEQSLINALQSEATFINTHEAGLNFRLCVNDDAPFRGIGRSYGMFRGVNNYLACIIDPTFEHALERAGFYAQQFVIKAHAAGLGTCFVGGTFSRSHVNAHVEVYEKIPFVVALGHPDVGNTSLLAKFTTRMAHRKHLDPIDFFDGSSEDYADALREFPWLDTALRAVACAPSALNTRPVRLACREVEGVKRITAHTIAPEKYAAELGIAKFNVRAVVPGGRDWAEGAVFSPD